MRPGEARRNRLLHAPVTASPPTSFYRIPANSEPFPARLWRPKIIRIDKTRLSRRNPSRRKDSILPLSTTGSGRTLTRVPVTDGWPVWKFGGVHVNSSKRKALPLALPIPLALPSLEAKALAVFVKRVDFETVANLSAVTVVSDGKSEADLIWQALIALRSALAAADAKPR
jgi:hypothetical protein